MPSHHGNPDQRGHRGYLSDPDDSGEERYLALRREGRLGERDHLDEGWAPYGQMIHNDGELGRRDLSRGDADNARRPYPAMSPDERSDRRDRPTARGRDPDFGRRHPPDDDWHRYSATGRPFERDEDRFEDRERANAGWRERRFDEPRPFERRDDDRRWMDDERFDRPRHMDAGTHASFRQDQRVRFDEDRDQPRRPGVRVADQRDEDMIDRYGRDDRERRDRHRYSLPEEGTQIERTGWDDERGRAMRSDYDRARESGYGPPSREEARGWRDDRDFREREQGERRMPRGPQRMREDDERNLRDLEQRGMHMRDEEQRAMREELLNGWTDHEEQEARSRYRHHDRDEEEMHGRDRGEAPRNQEWGGPGKRHMRMPDDEHSGGLHDGHMRWKNSRSFAQEGQDNWRAASNTFWRKL